MSYKQKVQELYDRIVHVNELSFADLALEVFKFQAKFNQLYAQYLALLNINPEAVGSLDQIPFLPIQFFKNYEIKTGNWDASLVFSSSGTTGTQTSRHYLKNTLWYKENARRAFKHFYGKIENYCVLALLPSYLERTGSSLVFMAQDFIGQSNFQESGFFLYNTADLLKIIKKCQRNKIPCLLIGVTFALLELAEKERPDLSGLTVMETGGMKGRRKELTRDELHANLRKAFNLEQIHSEYGMTELLSQAYSKGEGIFYTPPTMKLLSREVTDPLSNQKNGKTGAINIIDLANIDTVSFIATDDLGKVYEDGSFEILGRMDQSDIRGCNLLIDN